MLGIQKIISGGQTGADRAALDFALANGIEIGGYVPKGRLAEDGVISENIQTLSKPKPQIRREGRNSTLLPRTPQ